MTNRCAEGYEEKSIDPPYEGYMCLNINATQPVSTTAKTTKTTIATTSSPCDCSCPSQATGVGINGDTSINGVTYHTSTTSNSIITFISGLLIAMIISV